MADPKVTLQISADAQGVIGGIDAARRELGGLGEAGEKAGRRTRAGADEANSGLAALTKQIAGVAAGFASLAAVTSTLKTATTSAIQFESAMAEVSTLLSDTSGMDGLTESVRRLSREFGGSSTDQAKALYQIISAGASDSAQAIDILTASNKLAIGGITDVTTAADGLTTILNAFGTAAGDATAVSDKLFNAALQGKTTIGELAASIGSVAPLAAQAGVALDEVLAGTAALTLGGVKTSTAMDGLRAVIATILKPSKEAADLAAQLGLQFDAQALKAKGLAGFLEEVREKTGGSAEKMAILLGGVEALAPVLSLTGSQADNFARILQASAESAGNTEVAYAKMSETAAQSFARLRSGFADMLLDLGAGIRDVLGPAAATLADNLGLVESALKVAAVAALVFAGAKGLAAASSAAGLLSTGIAALIVKLNIVTPLFAWATGGMTGMTAAMLAARSAGGALFAMIGGWPTIIAASVVGLGLLLQKLTSVHDEAIAMAQQARAEREKTNKAFLAARQSARLGNADLIAQDIAAQEQLIARMTGRFSEQSVAMQSARERLVALRAEYVRAGGQLETLTGTTTGANAAADKFNSGLREQAQRLREQIAQVRGGAAAVAELRAAEVDWSKASAAQRAEQAQLTKQLRDLEGELKAVQAATRGRTSATRDAATADQDAATALRAHKQAMDALKGASLDFERLQDRVADALATPAERAQREYEEAIAVVDRFEAALMELGPIDPALLDTIERTRAGLEQVRDQAVNGGQEIVDSAETQAQQWGDAWDTGAGQVMRAIEDWGRRGFRGLGDELSNMMRDIRGQLVAMFARPLVIPILAQLGLGGAGGAGGQGGLLQSLMGQGGLFGGGTPLGGGFGNFFSQLSGSISTGVGAALSNLGGFFSQGAAFQGAGVLGSIGNFGSGLATAGANIGGAGFFGSMGANLSQGFAAIGSGSIAAGLGQVIPVIGQVYAALRAVDSITGGRIFGRGFQTTGLTQTLTLGAGGATATATEQQRRRGSLFGGSSRRRDVARDVDPAAQQDADEFFGAVGAAMRAAAAAMASTVAPVISGSIRQISEVDKQGRVTATRILVNVLGRQWEEATIEAARSRLASEALISQIDASLGTTAQAAAQAIEDAAAQGIQGAAGGIGAAFGDSLSDSFGEGVATMLKNATSAVQGEASAIAERWRGDAATLADGAQMLLLAATDIRRGTGLLGDGSLTAVADLIEDLAGEGEALAATYVRVSASTQLLQQALDLSGLSLDRTREEFVRLATGIAEAAGGLDRAQQLWARYYQDFFSDTERALLAQQRALAAALREFEDIGRNLGDFTGEGGLQAFRTAFEEVLQTGAAEAIVQWLEAAEALGILTAATAQLGAGAALVAESLTEFMTSIDAALAEFAPAAGLQQQLEAQRAANDELIARAVALGASEVELARVRELGDARIRAIVSSVAQQTATLTGALRQLGLAVGGTAEEVALMAAQISDDFQSLFDEFLGSFYDDAERAAMQLAVAQGNLTAALQAAGLSTDELISRTQLRAQIEAALAAGNVALAESLLRVASALNAVDAAAGAAASGVTGLVNNGNGQFWGGNSGGGIIGVGGNEGGAGGGAGQGLVDEIERIRRGLRDWLQSLTTGDLSPLRPRDQLREARAELARLVAAAQGGDLEAARQLQAAGQNTLRLGQQVLRGDAFRALFDEVRRMVGGVAGVGIEPIGGGGGGGGRPGDDLGELGRSAIGAAAALDMLAARAGMPPGSLTVPPPRPLPAFGGGSDQSFGDAGARPVVNELQRGRTAAAEDNARLRAEIAAMAAEMRELRAAAERQALELARANDYRRV